MKKFILEMLNLYNVEKKFILEMFNLLVWEVKTKHKRYFWQK